MTFLFDDWNFFNWFFLNNLNLNDESHLRSVWMDENSTVSELLHTLDTTSSYSKSLELVAIPLFQ